MTYEVVIDGVARTVKLTRPPLDRPGGESSRLRVVLDGETLEADAVEISPGTYSILVHGASHEVRVERTAQGLVAAAGGREFRIEIVDPRARRLRAAHIEAGGRRQVAAPMPGKVVRVLVEAGQKVEAGQGLVVVEAMKMQNEVRSPQAGTVEQVLAQPGQAVQAGEILAIIL